MPVPQWLRNETARYLPQGMPWGDTNIVFAPVNDRAANAFTIYGALAFIDEFAGIPDGYGALAAHDLKPIGSTWGDTITLDPTYAQGIEDGRPTAAGLGLTVHELWHRWQEQHIGEARFKQLYAALDARTPRDMPYMNPMEHAAYANEARAYFDMLSRGYPPGDWVPLGAQLVNAGVWTLN